MPTNGGAEHFHLSEIPRKYIRSGTAAQDYRDGIMQTIRSLQYTRKELEYSAQIAMFNIKSLASKNGFSPEPRDVFDTVENFAYHYENYCYRLFALREKVIQFMNAVLKIGYTGRDVNIKNLLINPTIKGMKLDKTLGRFGTQSKDPLGMIVKDRHALTHKLYYGQGIDHYLRPLVPFEVTDELSFAAWCKSWKQEIASRTELVGRAEVQVGQVNHELSDALMKHFTNK